MLSFVYFLYVCRSVSGVNDTADDETSDPEYDFLQEIDQELEEDEEEVRTDKAVRVSRTLRSLFVHCRLDLAELLFGGFFALTTEK